MIDRLITGAVVALVLVYGAALVVFVGIPVEVYNWWAARG